MQCAWFYYCTCFKLIRGLYATRAGSLVGTLGGTWGGRLPSSSHPNLKLLPFQTPSRWTTSTVLLHITLNFPVVPVSTCSAISHSPKMFKNLFKEVRRREPPGHLLFKANNLTTAWCEERRHPLPQTLRRILRETPHTAEAGRRLVNSHCHDGSGHVARGPERIQVSALRARCRGKPAHLGPAPQYHRICREP